MRIGIDGSRAFLAQRTGIEEYSYQTIKNLRDKLFGNRVVLYIRKNQSIDFVLPDNWQVKKIKWPIFWTQLGLSLEMIFHPVDVLFVPAHTVPIIHPENTIVTVHGLEYEFVPGAYSSWAKFYMRRVIKNSCRWASKIITVSQNTKKDLANLYKISSDKIVVINEGYETDIKMKNCNLNETEKFRGLEGEYLLFVGRLEERKNIIGIVRAFELLKEKHNFAGKLVLAGKPGYGYENAMQYLAASKHKNEIVMPGFVSTEEKCKLFGKAAVFMFPTFYEGFGIPILEAQSMGVPVVASNASSIEEVADGSVVLVNSNEPAEIAERTNVLLKDKFFREEMIKKGHENVKRFSWEKCAFEIAEILTK